MKVAFSAQMGKVLTSDFAINIEHNKHFEQEEEKCISACQNAILKNGKYFVIFLIGNITTCLALWAEALSHYVAKLLP